MHETAPPKIRAPDRWVVWGGAAVLLGAVVAAGYAAAEVWLTGGLIDAPLVVFVTLNSLIVYRLGCSLSKDLGRLFFYLPKAGADPQASVDRLLGRPVLALAGIGFAGFIAIAASNIDPWTGSDQLWVLRGWFYAFLFANNLMIGAVLFAIVHFWHILLKELQNIEISVLNLSSPALCALLKVNSRLVMGTALVSSLAVCSIPLSSYAMNPVTQLFSALALLFVIATYAVPILPLSNVLAARKAEALDRLERLIEAHVRHRSGEAPQPGMPNASEDLPPLSDLIEARDIVASVRTLPPGGQFSVSAAAVVAFLSFLPTLIDYAVSKLP